MFYVCLSLWREVSVNCQMFSVKQSVNMIPNLPHRPLSPSILHRFNTNPELSNQQKLSLHRVWYNIFENRGNLHKRPVIYHQSSQSTTESVQSQWSKLWNRWLQEPNYKLNDCKPSETNYLSPQVWKSHRSSLKTILRITLYRLEKKGCILQQFILPWNIVIFTLQFYKMKPRTMRNNSPLLKPSYK